MSPPAPAAHHQHLPISIARGQRTGVCRRTQRRRNSADCARFCDYADHADQAWLAPGECAVSKPIYRQTQGAFRFQEHALQRSAARTSDFSLSTAGTADRRDQACVALKDCTRSWWGAARRCTRCTQWPIMCCTAAVSWSRSLARPVWANHGWRWNLCTSATAFSALALAGGCCLEMTQGVGYAPFVDLLRLLGLASR